MLYKCYIYDPEVTRKWRTGCYTQKIEEVTSYNYREIVWHPKRPGVSARRIQDDISIHASIRIVQKTIDKHILWRPSRYWKVHSSQLRMQERLLFWPQSFLWITMPQDSPLTPFQKGQVNSYYEAKWSYRRIAAIFGCTVRAQENN